jgi:DNA polymerase-3 subunit gamma/tau
MSYLVLARKYRPQTFSEVVGQDHVTRTLANAFAQDRVHHAFLFCGPRGVGKTTAARILGKALNCARGPTAEPCGTCSPCQTITAGSAVDYYEMDGASNRGIDAIRELREAVRYQPAALRKKVYVIDEVHMLTTEAFNALLKTLEEPPPHVTFVLATTEPHKVPHTILSRCQRYDFKLVPSAILAEHLRRIFADESLTVEAAAVDLLVRESGGSVRDALSLADQVISFVGAEPVTEARVAEVLGVADRALTRGLIDALVAGNAGAALGAVDAALERGVDEVQIARALTRSLRDLAVLQAAPGVDRLVDGSPEERAELAALARELDPARLSPMFERMVRACDELAQTQMPRMVLDLALIDLATLEPMLPLGDLLARLELLERRLGPGAGGPDPGARVARTSSRSGTGATAAPSTSAAPAAQVPAAPAPARAQAPAPRVRAAIEKGTLTGSLSSPAPMQEWEGLIGALETAKRLTLVGVYQHARLLSWADDAIVVGCPEGSLSAAIAADRDNIAAMRKFLAERYGRALRFDVATYPEEPARPGAGDASAAADDGSAPRSLAEIESDRADTEREQRESEAREHPLTKKVLRTFGARIKEIKVHG